MAIDLAHWKMILAAGVKGKALSAGYPDLLIKWEEIPDPILGGHLLPRHDSEQIAKHHGFAGPIFDAVKVFAHMGLELEVIDRAVLRGGERVVDLNQAGGTYQEAQYLGEYDLVIDPGTSEHCFNIPQALVNLAGAVKVGGVISQALPMSMFNHGYWNINPVALLDFYEANGFQIEKMVIRHPSGVFEPPPADRGRRMKGVPEGAVNIITARRLEKKPFTWPQQKL